MLVQSGVQAHRQRQRRRRQDSGHGVLPPPVPGQQAPAEHGVYIQQPVFQKAVGKIHRVPRSRGQHPGDPQHIPHQAEAYPAQHPGRRQPYKAHQHRHKARHEVPSRRRNGQQVADGGGKGQDVEVDGRQWDGENQSRDGRRHVGAQEVHRPSDGPACPGVKPGQIPVQLRRQPHQSQGGRKTQLQADASGGEGVGQQNHQQRRAQAGKAVAVPLEQGRRQHEGLHDARPHHRRRQAHHQHIKRQHCHGYPSGQPSPAAQQQAQQAHQKRAVQAGHGEQVGKSCLGHGRLVRHGQAAPVSGQLRRDKGGGGLVIPDGGDLFPQGPGRPLGQPAQAPGAARLLRHVPLDIQQGEHAPGGEGGHVVFVDAPGILPAGVAGDPLSRLQLGQLLAAVADRLDAPEPLRIHRDLGSPLRQLTIVFHRCGKRRLPAAAVQHRLLHQVLIPAIVHQPRAQREQHHRGPQPQLVRQTAAQQHRRQAHCPADDCRPPGPPGPGQQHRRENGGGKGQRYGGQRPHDDSLLCKNFYPHYTRFPVPEQPRRRAL